MCCVTYVVTLRKLMQSHLNIITMWVLKFKIACHVHKWMRNANVYEMHMECTLSLASTKNLRLFWTLWNLISHQNQILRYQYLWYQIISIFFRFSMRYIFIVCIFEIIKVNIFVYIFGQILNTLIKTHLQFFWPR